MDTSKQKPDLMGKSGAPADGVKRILAHLEHGAKLPASKPARVGAWSFDGWTLGLAMMLLGMCCIAWLLHDGGKQSSGFKQGHGSSAARYEERHATIAVERTSSALASEDLSRQTPGALPEQPAAIINDPAAHVEARLGATTRPARDAGLRDAGLLNAFGLPASKADAVAHARSTAPGRTTNGAPARSARADAGAVAAGASASGATGAGRTSASANIATRDKTPAANDTDIALLTALVAHAGKPTVVIPERSRDIVERFDGDNTADLLARCKQLGVIEGMLCRSRICSGRWDSDPVCRAPAQ